MTSTGDAATPSATATDTGDAATSAATGRATTTAATGTGTLPRAPRTPGASTSWVSWLRFVAICGVVVIHAASGTAASPDAPSTLHGRLAILLDIGAIFTVPVFVMVSGALLLDPASYKGPRAFLRHRTWRIVVPLVFWHLWYVADYQVRHQHDASPRQLVAMTMNGTLSPVLYFFWIILGLSLLSPLLIPFLAQATRRQVVIAGVAAALVPVLTISTTDLRGADVVMVETPWTWWLPYLGVFLLGWGLRGVVLRGLPLAALTVGTAALGALLVWQFAHRDSADLLQTLSPVSYYGIGVVTYAVAIFLVFQGWLRPDGPLRAVCSPRGVRLGRLLGDATLGVFALHVTLLQVIEDRVPHVGGGHQTHSVSQLLARIALLLLATWAIVLPLRRLPVVRRVL